MSLRSLPIPTVGKRKAKRTEIGRDGPLHWFLSDCRVMASMSVDMIVLSPVTIVPEWLVMPAGCEVLQA